MAQRMVQEPGAKIRDAHIPYAVPGTDEMPERLDAVLTVIYLIFNEGYAATRGGPLIRTDLCAEAIRLGRLVRTLTAPQPLWRLQVQPAGSDASATIRGAPPVSMRRAISSFSKSRTGGAGINRRSPRLCR